MYLMIGICTNDKLVTELLINLNKVFVESKFFGYPAQRLAPKLLVVFFNVSSLVYSLSWFRNYETKRFTREI
ncbi:hypothetical protein BpHYR1_052641 [Brachionus plicatilis]|uniref:Uncharacterized protein n=1 Tax=Brachionus plicatilis TaxID=10195 RepID=A0A3M7S9E7_BRAPC|nr:hypothetical protein BpHYR1_052641 [Brachionus plicatilis]